MTNVVSFAQASLDERCRQIKASIAEGDKATATAEAHYKAAGHELKKLKAEHTKTWAEWEILVKAKVGISKSRASELMQIADGRKTLEEIRIKNSKRVQKVRAQSSPLRSGERKTELRMSSSPDKNKAKDEASKKKEQHREKIAKAITDGMPQKQASAKFGIGKTTFYEIRKQLIADGKLPVSNSPITTKPSGGDEVLAMIEDESICKVIKQWAKDKTREERADKAYRLVIPLIGDDRRNIRLFLDARNREYERTGRLIGTLELDMKK